MKAVILAFALTLIAAPALAEVIAPADAPKHYGQTVIVEGVVSNVHTTGKGMTFIDMGGRYPDNLFTAVIFPDDADKFPDVDDLEGKTVAITGLMKPYKGKPEIILKSADQIKIK